MEFYLHGGRYISTDNAYVSAQKILVTPEISGTVDHIAVTEGQRLKAGDVLFTVDRRPYEMAHAAAEAALATAANDYAATKARLQSLAEQIVTARNTIAVRQADLDRKQSLLASHIVADAGVAPYKIDLEAAKSALEVLEQSERDALSQLGGDANASLETYAPWLAAKSARDQARWNLDHTKLVAPMDGVATQVANIQLGRYITAGTPVFAIVSDNDIWIDANPKETDITYLLEGQPVSIVVDAFPGHEFTGHVASISPGTGAQFSIIPPQNAAGNWVKVVQRVPVRIDLDAGQDTARLRAGMSVNVDIDTGRVRSFATLIGAPAEAHTASP